MDLMPEVCHTHISQCVENLAITIKTDAIEKENVLNWGGYKRVKACVESGTENLEKPKMCDCSKRFTMDRSGNTCPDGYRDASWNSFVPQCAQIGCNKPVYKETCGDGPPRDEYWD
jgi:hypothetical protein